jgi:hypothetical protein
MLMLYQKQNGDCLMENVLLNKQRKIPHDVGTFSAQCHSNRARYGLRIYGAAE